MGLEINTGNAVNQINQINSSLSSAATEAYVAMNAVRAYIGSPQLKGQAYESARSHYEYHIVILEGMLSYIDEMAAANQQYCGKISAHLYGLGYVNEDNLQRLLNKVKQLRYSTGDIAPIFLNSLNRMEDAIVDKLERLYDFDSDSRELYTSANEILDAVKMLIGHLAAASFNPATGKFTIPATANMNCVDHIKGVWEQKRKNGMKAIVYEEGMPYVKGFTKCSVCGYDPINLNTGNFVYQKEDLLIIGQSSLKFERFYNAIDTRKGSLGPRWLHNYEIRLEVTDDRLTLFKADGSEVLFMRVEEGIYINGHTGTERITKECHGEKSQFRYVSEERVMHIFSGAGLELNRTGEQGEKIEFTYNQNGKLIMASSKEGALTYTYDEEQLLSKVSDHTGRMVSFAYKETYLSEVTLISGHKIGYHYGSNGKIKSITNPRGITYIENEYDSEGRVTRQTYPDKGSVRLYYYDEKQQVKIIEQNGNQVIYGYDNKYRNIKSIYSDGEEQFGYNDQNLRTYYKDKRGNETNYEYDNIGNLVQVTDALGNQVKASYEAGRKLSSVERNGVVKQKFSYDEQGNLLQISDALARTSSFAYNENRLPVTVSNPDGSEVHIEYDLRGNIAAIVNAAGSKTVYCYDNLNRVIETVDGNGNKTAYGYDDFNNLIYTINDAGNRKEFTYNESNKVTSVTDYDGSKISLEYGHLHKPEKVVDQLGNITTYEYDKMWNIAKEIKANGAETEFVYDKLNRLEKVTNALGKVVKYKYDPNGNRTKVIRPNGAETRFVYDALNRLTEVIEAGVTQTVYEYDSEGRVVKELNALGQATCYKYDEAGQKISEVDPVGNETRYSYTALGQVEVITAPNGQQTVYTYEPGGLLARVTLPDGRFETYKYDGNQNLTRKTNQDGHDLYYSYDSLDRIVAIKSNQGQEKRYSYDAVGNILAMTDANGNITTYSYDKKGNRIKVTDALFNYACYEYDELGNLAAVHQYDESSGLDKEYVQGRKYNERSREVRTISYKRNKIGQVEEIVDALGKAETYSYDVLGNVKEKVDRDGYVTSFSYTNAGDLSRITYDDGREVKYSYNALRQLVEFQDWLGITKIEQDSLGRVAKVTDPKGREVSYTWGLFGEQESITYPNGKSVYFKYDKQLRLQELRDGELVVNYQYDAGNRITEKLYSNGIKTSYQYNSGGLLTGLMHYDKKGVLDKYQYEYDLLGNKVKIEKNRSGLAEDNGIFEYTYDSINRLLAVKRNDELLRSYEYDGFGNRISLIEGENKVIYSFNKGNQLIAELETKIDGNANNQSRGISETKYRYDQRGNLVETHKNKVPMNQYQFGALNRLEIAVNHETGKGASYEYNGLSHRVGKTEGNLIEAVLPINKLDELTLNPSKKIEDVLDLTRQYHNLLQRTENDNATSYTWDSNVVSADGANSKAQYLQDELGSPIRILDNSGIERDVYGYDEFGQNTCNYKNNAANSLHDIVQPFTYTGYQSDEIADTYYAQAREYKTAHGRFISKDLDYFIRSDKLLSTNLYLYCVANPLKYVDRNGHDCYVFYLPEWEHEALDDQKKLAKKYNIDMSEVHLIPVTDNASLTDGWNNMGTVNENEVDIDAVIINTHANPQGLGFGNNSNDFFDAESIENLQNQEIEKLILYGCNAGHLDHVGTNPASQFARVVDGAPVMASDGTVYSGYYSFFGFFGTMWYKSRADNAFLNWAIDGKRDNMGWVIYSLEGEEIVTKNTGNKIMKLRDMVTKCSLD